jgi:hypothetical protein
MKKPVQIALILGIVALAGVSTALFVQNQKTSEQLATTQLSEAEVQDRYGKTIEAIAEIQDSLNALALEETGASLSPGSTERSNREASLDRIATLRASIAQSKERIRSLEAQLKDNGVKVAGLGRLIGNLKKSVSDKEQQIALLETQVDDLNTQVTGLTVAVAQKDDTLQTRVAQLEEKRRELATIYYVIGTQDELKDSGVIRSSGGVLGIGKTVVPTAAPDLHVFSAIDTDETNVIRTPSAKAKVVSAQPVGSYEMRLVNGQMEVHILDPDEFRKVKQVVILTS